MSTGNSSRLIDTLRYEGPWIALWKALVRLLSPLAGIEALILLEKSLSDPIEARPAKVAIDVDIASEDDLEAIVALRFKPVPPEPKVPQSYAEGAIAAALQADRSAALAERAYALTVERERMRRGGKCFVARIDGEIVHHNWLFFDWGIAANPRSFFVLREGEVLPDFAFTVPAWRGKAIHEAVQAEMLCYARQAGHRWAYSLSQLENVRSRKGLHRIGYRVRGRFLLVRPRLPRREFPIRLSGRLDPLVFFR